MAHEGTEARALHFACDALDFSLARQCLDEGADPNGTDSLEGYGFTPLFLTARAGHVGLTTLLLDRGADVDKPTLNKAWTPLYIASCAGQSMWQRCSLTAARTSKKRTPTAKRLCSPHAPRAISTRRRCSSTAVPTSIERDKAARLLSSSRAGEATLTWCGFCSNAAPTLTGTTARRRSGSRARTTAPTRRGHASITVLTSTEWTSAVVRRCKSPLSLATSTRRAFASSAAPILTR
mmetsp:Transcript_27578/g.85180  ORF Transcript_27578/g.85180 Transcript_27578/m.85180 type:complete len:236 (-) Transcript_27578:97-804(-)